MNFMRPARMEGQPARAAWWGLEAKTRVAQTAKLRDWSSAPTSPSLHLAAGSRLHERKVAYEAASTMLRCPLLLPNDRDSASLFLLVAMICWDAPW